MELKQHPTLNCRVSEVQHGEDGWNFKAWWL